MASVLGKRKAPAAATGAATSSAAKKKNAGAATSSAATAKSKLKKKAMAKSASATAPTKTKETKKKVQEEEEEEADTSFADAQEIFRRHFEASFKPIAPGPKRKKARVEAVEEDEEGESDEEDLDEDVGADGQEEGEDEEWGGLSGAEDYDSEEEDDSEDENPVVEVVDHTNSKPLPAPSMSKREMKAFMSSKPPSQTDPTPSAVTTALADAAEDEDDDKSNLANDLALQRLLSESHLLARHSAVAANNPAAAAKPFAAGRLRQRQLDLRAQALAPPGVAASLFKQDKMPMAFRKGMNANAAERESRRRRQARENGVVLEREAPKKQKRGRAERAVDGPAVGRMKGAELRLSERDIQSIEGGGGRGRGGGGRGGFGGRGGGRGRGRR